MIEGKFVDLYARDSGLRDKLIAERDIVLSYVLRGLIDDGVMDHLTFKGGTCLRKMIFGSAGRFSEDLDFTLDSELPEDPVRCRALRDNAPSQRKRPSSGKVRDRTLTFHLQVLAPFRAHADDRT